MTNPRRVALDALTQITAEGQDVESALGFAGIGALEGRDRGFAYTLVMNGLRWGRAADACLAQYIAKPIPERKHRAQWALRLGVVQLRVLGVPAHAAVSTTVALLKKGKDTVAYAGMANAVLKKLANDTLDPAAALPEWLRTRWAAQYGEPVMQAMAKAVTAEPMLDLTVKPGVTLEGEPIGAQSIRLPMRDVMTLPGFAEGEWWVQDMASTLPAQLLGEVKGLRVLDACAAPGGKTAQLCVAGADVTALDRSPARLARMRENMERLQLAPNMVEADIASWEPTALFDAILLDAPCSATGTLRRHPEIGWQRRPEELERLAAIQAKLLTTVWAWLKPGGKLVYSVCSLEAEEGEAQLDAFLQAHPDAAILPASLPEGAAPEGVVGAAGYVRSLPSHWADKGGMDGFFAACLEKRK